MNVTTLVEQYDSDLVKRTRSVICFVILTRLVALYVFWFCKKNCRLKEPFVYEHPWNAGRD